MRIILFADSLGRARPDLPAGQRSEYEQVYGYLLRRMLHPDHEVEICYFDSLDTQDALPLAERQVAFRKPDVVVFHLGINDCAPRVFRKNSRNIIFQRWFPAGLRKLILGAIHRYRRPLTRHLIRNRVYVPPAEFRRNFETMRQVIRQYSPACQFIAISIAPTLSALDHRSYGYNANVARYNALLQDLFAGGYLDLDHLLGGDPETYLIADGVHLTLPAHQTVAEALCARIRALAVQRDAAHG